MKTMAMIWMEKANVLRALAADYTLVAKKTWILRGVVSALDAELIATLKHKADLLEGAAWRCATHAA